MGTISSPHSRVRCAGHQVSVEEKVGMMDGSHCGLCGDYNGEKKAEVKSPRGCSYSSYQAAARSYKVESSSCSAMSSAEKAEQGLRQQDRPGRESAGAAPPARVLGRPGGAARLLHEAPDLNTQVKVKLKTKPDPDLSSPDR